MTDRATVAAKALTALTMLRDIVRDRIEKSTHPEYRDFKGHTRTLMDGRVVPVKEYHRLMEVKGDGYERRKNGKKDDGGQGIPGKERDDAGTLFTNVLPITNGPEGFIQTWEVGQRERGTKAGMALSDEGIGDTTQGEHYGIRSSMGKENKGDQRVSGKKGSDDGGHRSGIHRNALSDGLIRRWARSVTEYETGEQVDLSDFKLRNVKSISEILSHWPSSTIKYLTCRMDNKKLFVVLKDKENIPISNMDEYEKSKGVCLDGEQIDIVEGIHGIIDDKNLKHETCHLLYHSIYKIMNTRGDSAHAVNCEKIINEVIIEKINNIDRIVNFCSNDDWSKDIKGINSRSFEKLTWAVNVIRVELKDADIKHREFSKLVGGYDETPSLISDLMNSEYDISRPLKEIGDYLKIKTIKNKRVATILWHGWMADKYKSRINNQYVFDEPMAYSCDSDPELFNRYFAAAQKDFPELFMTDDTRKAIILKSLVALTLIRDLIKARRTDPRQMSLFDDSNNLHSEKVDVKASTRTNPVTGKISPVVQHTQTVKKKEEQPERRLSLEHYDQVARAYNLTKNDVQYFIKKHQLTTRNVYGKKAVDGDAFHDLMFDLGIPTREGARFLHRENKKAVKKHRNEVPDDDAKHYPEGYFDEPSSPIFTKSRLIKKSLLALTLLRKAMIDIRRRATVRHTHRGDVPVRATRYQIAGAESKVLPQIPTPAVPFPVGPEVHEKTPWNYRQQMTAKTHKDLWTAERKQAIDDARKKAMTPQQQLVYDHIDDAGKLATFYAKKYFAKTRGAIEPDEFEQAALLGMVEASQKYDPTRGVAFMTFAHHFVGKRIFRMVSHVLDAVSLPENVLERWIAYQQSAEKEAFLSPEKVQAIDGEAMKAGDRQSRAYHEARGKLIEGAFNDAMKDSPDLRNLSLEYPAVASEVEGSNAALRNRRITSYVATALTESNDLLSGELEDILSPHEHAAFMLHSLGWEPETIGKFFRDVETSGGIVPEMVHAAGATLEKPGYIKKLHKLPANYFFTDAFKRLAETYEGVKPSPVSQALTPLQRIVSRHMTDPATGNARSINEVAAILASDKEARGITVKGRKFSFSRATVAAYMRDIQALQSRSRGSGEQIFAATRIDRNIGQHFIDRAYVGIAKHLPDLERAMEMNLEYRAPREVQGQTVVGGSMPWKAPIVKAFLRRST